jgi:fatty-acyl-CoA synthase
MDLQTRLQPSYFKGADTPPLLDVTIADYLDGIAARFADREALVVPYQGIRWTYDGYLREIEKLAAGLLALGIGAGDRVGIWSPNGYEWCLTQFATAKIGAILVNINPAYRVFELEYALQKSGCKAVVAAEQFKSSRYLEMLQNLAPELAICAPGRLRAQKLPQLEAVIRMGSAHSPGMLNFDELRRLGGAGEMARLREVQASLSPRACN